MFSRALEREEHCKHISLECVGSAHRVSDILGLSHSWCVCLNSLYCSDSRLLCQELFQVGPGLHALPRSKLLRFRHSTKAQTRLGLCSVPFPGPSSSGDQLLGKRAHSLRPNASPIPAAWFSGCTTGTPSQVCHLSLLGS